MNLTLTCVLGQLKYWKNGKKGEKQKNYNAVEFPPLVLTSQDVQSF